VSRMKVTRYMIRAGEAAYPERRRIIGPEFKTKREAKRYIKKLIAPGRINKYGIRLTAYRDALSGSGIVNPRIVKMEVYR